MNPLDSLKDKIRQEEALPEHLSWDNSKDGIYSKMKDIDKPVSRFKTPFLFRMAILIFIFLLVGIAAIFYLKKQHIEEDNVVSIPIANTSDEVIKSDHTTHVINDNEISIIEVSTQNNFTDQPSDDKTVETNASAINATTEDQNANITSLEEVSDTNDLTSFTEVSMDKSQARNIGENQNVSSILDRNNIGVSQAKNTEPIDELLNKEVINSIYFVVNQLALIDINLIMEEREPMLLLSPEILNIEEKANDESINYFVQLGSGINYSASNYGSSLQSQDVAAYESFEHGYSSSFRFNLSRKSLFLSTGIDWKRTYRQIEGTVFNEFKEVRNMLVEVEHHPFTGFNDIYQDTLVNVTQTDSFKHHNSLEFFSIPLVVGFQKESAKFYYNLGLGLGFSFRHKTQGRTLRNHFPLKYEVDNTLFKTSFGIDVIGEIGLGYRLTDHINVGGRLSYIQKTQNYSLDQNIKMYPSILNGELVVGYNF